MTRRRLLPAACGLALLSAFASDSRADDWTMWGGTPDRNMVSPGKNPPTEWEVGEPTKPGDGTNIVWEAQLGSQSYGNPVVANGIVYVGTNNEAKRDPNFTADGGVLAAFRASDGKFLWQQYSPKLPSGRVNDWPYQGICSTPYVEGDALWYTTSRCEVICLDVSPLRYDKGPPVQLWKLDMMEQLGVFPHNMTSCSILAHEDLIYVITGNGVDETHKNIPAPKAPAIICVNKKTGKVVWQDNSPGDAILHGQWASPALAVVNGRAQVIAPLGDSWVYAFDAETGKIVWKFDTNPKASVYPATRNELIATPVIHDNKMYIVNGQDPEHGEGVAHFWCVDITKTGDVSAELPGEEVAPAQPGEELLVPAGAAKPRKGRPNPNSAVVWHYEKNDEDGNGKIRRNERMNRSISTVAIADGLVFIPDFSGFVHCLDAKTGQKYWAYDMEAAMWGSPLAVDGKVYLCDEDGDVAIFEVSNELKEVGAAEDRNLGSAAYCSPVYANGVMYLMNRERLFAIRESK